MRVHDGLCFVFPRGNFFCFSAEVVFFAFFGEIAFSVFSFIFLFFLFLVAVQRIVGLRDGEETTIHLGCTT